MHSYLPNSGNSSAEKSARLVGMTSKVELRSHAKQTSSSVLSRNEHTIHDTVKHKLPPMSSIQEIALLRS